MHTQHSSSLLPANLASDELDLPSGTSAQHLFLSHTDRQLLLVGTAAVDDQVHRCPRPTRKRSHLALAVTAGVARRRRSYPVVHVPGVLCEPELALLFAHLRRIRRFLLLLRSQQRMSKAWTRIPGRADKRSSLLTCDEGRRMSFNKQTGGGWEKWRESGGRTLKQVGQRKEVDGTEGNVA
eukprot:761550-Hanusia_phi.AAC.7